MVQVVSRVPDGHVLEQYAICSKDVIRPGPELSYVLLYPPFAYVIQPHLATREEVQTHVHHTRRHEFVHDGFCLWCNFRLCQVGIEISGHQEINPKRSMTCSSPRFPLRSYSLVCIENHLFIVGIGPILNKELELIFRSNRSDRTCVYS